MSQRQTLLTIGICTFILPFLGLPSNWKSFLTLLIGVILVGLSYYQKKQERPSSHNTQQSQYHTAQENQEEQVKVTPTFVESRKEEETL